MNTTEEPDPDDVPDENIDDDTSLIHQYNPVGETEARMDIGFVATGLTRIGDVKIPDIFYNRFKTGIEEVDHLFGDGILPGCVITCCGAGGTGKTTLWLQALCRYQDHGLNIGYFSGEESIEQLAYKSEKLNVKDVPVANENDLDVIIKCIQESDLDFIIIDSFQALTCEAAAYMRGRRLQQHMVNMICNAAKDNVCTIVIIMHMTKGGQLKGDTCVPHTVDVNMVIRSGFKEYGDKSIRILDIPIKNRYGPCVEVLAKMTESGYSFGVEVEPISDESTGSAVPKANKRSENKKQEMQKIMEIPYPVLTPDMVMEAIDVDFNYAYGRLTELTRNKKLTKIGKGVDAVFKKN